MPLEQRLATYYSDIGTFHFFMLSSNNSFFPYRVHLRVTVCVESEHNFVVPYPNFIQVIILLSAKCG